MAFRHSLVDRQDIVSHARINGPHAWSIQRTISMALNAGMGSVNVMLWNAVFLISPTWSAFVDDMATSIATQLWTSAAWDLDLTYLKKITPWQKDEQLTRGLSYQIEVHYDNPDMAGE